MFLTKETTYILAQRVWQSIAGLISATLIAHHLSPDHQGWYYTFIGLISLYSIFEMGLSTTLLQVAAHIFSERAECRSVSHETHELQPLASKAFKVYQVLAVAFIIVVFPIGWYVFSANENKLLGEAWRLPWILIIIATALNMLMMPFLAIAEGLGEISEVYLVRLFQGIFGSIACWILLLSGSFLWAAAMAPVVGFIIAILWIIIFRAKLFTNSIIWFKSSKFSWAEHVWPLQWRIGISWLSIYCMSQLSTPILFYYRDAAVAGQMGLSLTVAHMFGILAQSWVARHIPKMTLKAKKRDWKSLDNLFIKDLKLMIMIYCAGIILMIILYHIFIHSPYIERFLPFWQLVGLLVFVLIFQINLALSSYLRSFKREPLMSIFFLGSTMIILGSLLVATEYSSTGIIFVMLFTEIALVLPLSLFILKRFRQIAFRRPFNS